MLFAAARAWTPPDVDAWSSVRGVQRARRSAALADAGAAEVVVVNRTRARAEEAAALAGPVGRVGDPSDIEAAELVVHATPSGMVGNGEALAIAPPGGRSLTCSIRARSSWISSTCPAETPILELRRGRGAATVGGIGMLVIQAALAIEHWTGRAGSGRADVVGSGRGSCR